MALREIELVEVEHGYGQEQLLRPFSLAIEKGEKIAILGPSGQGKSTLLKLIAGLIKPRRGKVYLMGEDFHQAPDLKRRKIRQQIGMLFQKNALFDSLTSSENVAFALRETTELSAEVIAQRVRDSLSAVGLEKTVDLYPDEMSGGMQKRLGIARAQVLQPKILLYDDPTAGLDPITSKKIVDLILELAALHHSTVVVVTNEVSRAFQLAQRIFFVVENEILDLGSPEQAFRSQDRRVLQFLNGDAEGPLTGQR